MSSNKTTAAEECEKLASDLPALIAGRAKECERISATMENLKYAGLIYARTHWREQKYFYLIYPTDSSGNRKREYIGTNAEKIKTSQDAIARAHEYDRLAADLARIEKRLNEARQHIMRAMSEIRAKW